jgi:crossover junction endodeoxyribonuclease RuvC
VRVLGIDPGGKGALALVGPHGTLDELYDMPTRKHTLAGGTVKTRIDATVLHYLIARMRPDAVFLEQVNSHSGEGAAGAFSFGRGVGVLEGVLGANGLQATEVPPATWKRLVGVRKAVDAASGKVDRKGPAKVKAAKIWPGQAVRLLKARADLSEAALIAWYGYLVLQDL